MAIPSVRQAPAPLDVLVVGGGITGSATAYHLVRAGLEVALVERADLNTEASGRNAGSLHAQIQHEPFVELGEEWARAFAPALAFMRDSIELWRGLSDELGVDLEVATKGGVLVAESEAQLRDIERKVAIERAHGLEAHLLSREDLRRVAPYLSERMIGGELCPAEGKANPLLAGPAFARAAREHGARLMLGTELRALAREGSGFRAETTAGAVLARRVVSCGGVEAGRITAMLGAPLPVDGHPIQVNVTEPVAPLVDHLVYFAGEKLTLKQARAGTLLIGGGWPARRHPATGRIAVDPHSLRANLQVARTVVPAVAGARLVRTWTGVGNGTPDHRPIIGEIESVPGLFVGTFPYMGFTAGPLMALLLADLVRGRTVDRDLAPFAPGRF